MSLMRLLSVGRSLGRATDAPTRYRVIRQGLPKFGPAEKPDGARGARAFEKNRNKTNDMPQPHADAKPLTPPAAAVGPDPAHRFPLGRWGFLRNPFGNATPAPKETRAVEPVAPVQGELSLDAVRPVRNDLTDSDVMIIRRAKASAELIPAPGPSAPQVDGPGGGREAEGMCAQAQEPVWGRLKSQLFGAGKA